MKVFEQIRGLVADAVSYGQCPAFHYQMAALSAVMAIAGLVLSFPVHYDGAVMRIVILPIAIGVVAAVILPAVWACWEWRPQWFPKALELTSTVIWVAAVWALSSLLVQVAVRSPFPLADSTLARLDNHLFHTVTVVHWIAGYPVLRWAFVIAYASLDPLTALALLVPIFRGRFNDSRTLLLAVTISLLLTLALFAVVPAIGPWTVEGFSPSRTQAPIGPYLIALKSGANTLGEEMSGIVAFPSFHTVLALLAGAVLWKTPKLRWITTPIALGVCIGTVTTGWHYVVDVIAGCAVALVSWFSAVRLVNRHPADARSALTPAAIDGEIESVRG